MAIAASIKEYLDAQGVDYELLTHAYAKGALPAARAAGIDPHTVAQAVLLKDWRGVLLAVFPADRALSIEAVNTQLRRTLTQVDDENARAIFRDCEPGATPTLGAAYGIKSIIEKDLLLGDSVFLQAGSHTELVRVSARGFLLLQRNAWRERGISLAVAHEAPPTPVRHAQSGRIQIRDQVSRVQRLPAMPEMAQRIMQLRANPYSDADDLARVIELDPSLAAQVIRYARAPLFGYRGAVVSIQQAVSRVLGYDMVLNVALGIATGGAFRIPPEGPLGLNAYWRHSVYAATLAQALGNALPQGRRPRPGMAYLAGLLHAFGYLLLGHLFPEHFDRLNHLVEANPSVPATELEQGLLDATHLELGTVLMESWHMPGEILIAVREHHNEAYDDVHAVYARLVLIANVLLARHGIGNTLAVREPAATLEWLELSEAQAENVLATVLAGGDSLDSIAQQFAA